MKSGNKIFLGVISIIALVTAGYFLFIKDSLSQGSDEGIKNDRNSIPIMSKDSVNQSIYQSRENIITGTVKKISNAVVGINVTEVRQYRDPFADDPFYRYFYGDRVYEKQIKGLGSGTIISSDGYILTNDHVAGNATKIIVTMTDGTQHDAEIIGTDQVSDICLLKIDADNLPFISLGNSNEVLIGEWVIALGNPFGLFELNDKPTVTVGVISATGMNLGSSNERFYLNMIQTDASINSGNSGGPLVNCLGELIGMNTLIYSQSGGSIGVGFAIPVNKIKTIIDELKDKGKIDRDFWTGLRIQTIDEGIAKYYDLPNTRGVIVTYVTPGSPAARAGLEVGDIITEVDNFKINNYDTLAGVLQEFRSGDNVEIKILRNNNSLTKKMHLETHND
ncbi:MAG: trypsin-like peptidase domain-containing protein [bacterium]